MLNVLLFLSSIMYCSMQALFRNHVYAFVLYQLIYFFYPKNRWWGGMVPDLSYSFFSVLLMFLCLLIGFKQYKNNHPFKSREFKIIYVLLAYIWLLSFFAILPFWHNDALVNYVKMVITMSIAYCLVKDKFDLKLILHGYLIGAAYLSFMVYQVGRTSGSRVEGIGTVDSPEANGLATVIAPSLIFSFYFFWRNPSYIKKLFYLACIAFSANAIVLINSRASMLGIIGCFAIFFFRMYASKIRFKNQRFVVIAFIFSGLIGATQVIDDSFVERFNSIFSQKVDENKETGATRTVFWSAAMDMAKDYPLGVGARGFEYLAPQYIPENVATGKSRNKSVHSTWFEAISEFGYIGFSLLLLIIYACFRSMRQALKILKASKNTEDYYLVLAIFCALICYLITASFMNRYRAEILYWLFLFAACIYKVFVRPQKGIKND
ncbi:O-antigen ligase family protein [Thalassotalea agariperforans]